MAVLIKKQLMKEDEIPSFVAAIVATGCDICAIGHENYVICEADLSPEELEDMSSRLAAIEEIFGERDFLKNQIAAYLRSVGRYVDLNERSEN